MAITYNNLYLDIRTRLRAAGVEMATLEARELTCFAAGKTREELYRDGALYASPAIEERARELGFYIQKYCGCVFSEQERYLKPTKIIP